MKLAPESDNPADFLQQSPVTDSGHPCILAKAGQLKKSAASETDLIRRTYEFVRDEISHSADVGGKIVTCKASEVLLAKQGICFAKSHLLAALLRGNGIPAGFCYQLLRLDGPESR